MTIRRKRRRSYGAGGETVSAADREAMQSYRINRGSSRYYADLKAIDTAPQPKKSDDTKK